MSKSQRLNKRHIRLLQWTGASVAIVAIIVVAIALATREKGEQVAAARAELGRSRPGTGVGRLARLLGVKSLVLVVALRGGVVQAS